MSLLWLSRVLDEVFCFLETLSPEIFWGDGCVRFPEEIKSNKKMLP